MVEFELFEYLAMNAQHGLLNVDMLTSELPPVIRKLFAAKNANELKYHLNLGKPLADKTTIFTY